jgi:hypothetical protein
MRIEIPELIRIEAKLDALLDIEAHRAEVPAWSSLKKAWMLKGGCAYETMRTRRYLQPNGGKVESYIGGVGVFSRETILEWLEVTDDKLEAYHNKRQTGCLVPEREIA